MEEWLTEQEAAEWIKVPVEDLHQAVSRGDLPVLKIGMQVRLSRTSLITHAGAAAIAPNPSAGTAARRTVDSDEGVDGRVVAPASLTWLDALTVGEPFEHHWPAKGGSYAEQYPHSWAGRVRVESTEMIVKIGRSTGAERNDGKARLTVLFDNYPMAEFMPTADGSGWASLIKPDGRHTVAPGDPIPGVYRRASTLPYQIATGMKGPGRPTGVALVIAEDDRDSAVYHAAARWLGKRGKAF